jgi:hypothetical protein
LPPRFSAQALAFLLAYTSKGSWRKRRHAANQSTVGQQRQEIRTVLMGSTVYNVSQLDSMLSIEAHRGFLEIGFDSARRNIVKDKAVELLDDLPLTADCAAAYEDLSRLENLVKLFRDYDVGILSTNPLAEALLGELSVEIERFARLSRDRLSDILSRLSP